MKTTTVKYFCDLCGKEIEKIHYLAWFMGSAFVVNGLIGTRRRIDLCDRCREFIRENGHIEKGEAK